MTKATLLPLESYQLARYAVPVGCFVCGSENTFDSEYCTHCLAPMALAHQAQGQKAPPLMVAVVGASGAGKTVYLGMLMDMLSRQQSPIHLLTRGAFSITLQQVTTAALARCEFPRKTPNEPERWNWVHCQIRRQQARRPVEIVMPDISGEAIVEEVDHPHSYRVIRELLRKSAAAMILVDAVSLEAGERSQDFFTMKLLSDLSEMTDPPAAWSKRPVAVIFTKADQCPACREDPAAFARSHAAGLWQHCQERFPGHRFFAAGVAGACAWRDSPRAGRVQVPLRIEPHGIVEPLEWLLKQGLGERGVTPEG